MQVGYVEHGCGVCRWPDDVWANSFVRSLRALCALCAAETRVNRRERRRLAFAGRRCPRSSRRNPAKIDTPTLRRAERIAEHFLACAGRPPPGIEVAIVVIASATGPTTPDSTWERCDLPDGCCCARGPGVEVLVGGLGIVIERVAIDDPSLAQGIRRISQPGYFTVVLVEADGGPARVARGRLISLNRVYQA
jgi:hypothetical protein